VFPGCTGELTPKQGPNPTGVTRLLLGKGSEAAHGVMGHIAMAPGAVSEAVKAAVCADTYQGFIVIFPASGASAAGQEAARGRSRSRSRSESPSGMAAAATIKKERASSPSVSPSRGGGGGGGGGGGSAVVLLSAEDCCYRAKTCRQDGGAVCRRAHPGDRGYVPVLCLHGSQCGHDGRNCSFYHPHELRDLVRASCLGGGGGAQMRWDGSGVQGWMMTPGFARVRNRRGLFHPSIAPCTPRTIDRDLTHPMTRTRQEGKVDREVLRRMREALEYHPRDALITKYLSMHDAYVRCPVVPTLPPCP
jgi:hypothetical protein